MWSTLICFSYAERISFYLVYVHLNIFIFAAKSFLKCCVQRKHTLSYSVVVYVTQGTVSYYSGYSVMECVILGGGADGVVFGCLTPEGEVRGYLLVFTVFHFLYSGYFLMTNFLVANVEGQNLDPTGTPTSFSISCPLFPYPTPYSLRYILDPHRHSDTSYYSGSYTPSLCVGTGTVFTFFDRICPAIGV